MDRTPYTYLIGWSHLNLWYYGVKYAIGCHPDQLWVSYFTSSKYVAETRSEHGEPDVIEIRKVFNNTKDARNWENAVLRRMKVVYDDKWLNKTDNKSIAPECCAHQKCLGRIRTEEEKQNLREAWKNRRLKPISEETREKIRATSTGRQHSEETKEYLRQLNLGKKMSDESIEKLRVARTGTKASEETKARMSEAQLNRDPVSEETRKKISDIHKGKPKPSEKIKENARRLGKIKMTCPHCSKEGSMANMKRWHFDNCKSKNDDLFKLFE